MATYFYEGDEPLPVPLATILNLAMLISDMGLRDQFITATQKHGFTHISASPQLINFVKQFLDENEPPATAAFTDDLLSLSLAMRECDDLGTK